MSDYLDVHGECNARFERLSEQYAELLITNELLCIRANGLQDALQKYAVPHIVVPYQVARNALAKFCPAAPTEAA